LPGAFAPREEQRPAAILTAAALVAIPLVAWRGMASEVSLSKNRFTRNAIFGKDLAPDDIPFKDATVITGLRARD
jgi:hypothetical protein